MTRGMEKGLRQDYTDIELSHEAQDSLAPAFTKPPNKPYTGYSTIEPLESQEMDTHEQTFDTKGASLKYQIDDARVASPHSPTIFIVSKS